MMDRKKEMIRELTNSAWSILGEYHEGYIQGKYTLEEAQSLAVSIIQQLRYGEDKKDYFWITNMKPVMIMHPYREELNGQDLRNYADPNGKKLFKEAASLVEEKGNGYIDYSWQWKDDSTKIVPKLSYVKGFSPWHWIIGTGIYLEDVREEINKMEGKITKISTSIIVIISIILFYIVKQSLWIERKRNVAESDLKLSRLKYKSLVEASTEGTLMIIDNKIIYSNLKFAEMSGYPLDKLLSMDLNELFDLKIKELEASLKDPNKSLSMEVRLKQVNQEFKDIVISISRVEHGGKNAYILVAKNIEYRERIKMEGSKLADELQDTLLLMNQPIHAQVRDFIRCNMNTSISEAAAIMSRKKQKVLLISGDDTGIIGIVTDSDLRDRVLAKKMNVSDPVFKIMSAPVFSIQQDALVFEATLLFKEYGVSHLVVKNDTGEVMGILSHMDILEVQGNTTSFLLHQIELAESIEDMKRIYARIPSLVKALLEAGSITTNITRVITSASDGFTRRAVELAIEILGPPPCRFSFIALGSEGRMEQTLSTDQDNAIIFEDVPENQQVETSKYFNRIGQKVNEWLNEIGYRYCPGEIMAGNERWCQPLEKWKKYFTGWIHDANPQDLLEVTIFFDIRVIYGDESLGEEIKTHINQSTENKPVFFYHLAQFVTRYKPPLNIFGNIVTSGHAEELFVDIKKNLIPIVGFARIYSLFHQIDQTNTIRRLEGMVKKGIIDKSMHDEIEQAYHFLMALRFKFQAGALLDNKEPGNRVEFLKLTDIEKSTMKKVFSSFSNLQVKLTFDFKGGAG